MFSLIDAYFLFVVLLQVWETISNKSPVMAQQEHLSLRMLAATVVMAPMPPTKQAMHQMPMEVERILDEGPLMFLVDSIHTDARELWPCFSQKCICSELQSFKTIHPG